MILPKVRDPRFVTIRRGGTLTDTDHHLLALWAASCAEHVLGLFEAAGPDDPRPRRAIETPVHGRRARSGCRRPARRAAMRWPRLETSAGRHGMPRTPPGRRRSSRTSPR